MSSNLIKEQQVNNKSSIITSQVQSPEVIKLKRFCKIVETNINNTTMPFHLQNTLGKGHLIQIYSLNGIKKQLSNSSNSCYLRFFLTFYSDQNEFFGNTAKSKPVKVNLTTSGYLEFDKESSKEPLSFYFFDLVDNNSGKIGVVTEVVFIEISQEGKIINQSCEGWGFFTVSDKMEKRDKAFFSLYYGTPRNLKFNKNLLNIEGGSISYACFRFSEIDHANFLLPTNIIIPGRGTENNNNNADKLLRQLGLIESNYLVPGLQYSSLPNNQNTNKDEYRLVSFIDVYLKNIEMTVPIIMEKHIIEFARKYFFKKINSPETNINNINISIKQRRLRCCVHNTWKFINTNGLENYTNLIMREGVLISNNIHHIDNFFEDNTGKVAFVFELSYIIDSSSSNSKINQTLLNNNTLTLSLLQGMYLPDTINAENRFSTVFMMANVSTVYGEELFPISVLDAPLKLNFIISRNKDYYEKTYKEEEIAKLKNEIELLKRNLADEIKRGLLNCNNISNNGKSSIVDNQVTGKLEQKIVYLQKKLQENQKSLKVVYDKEDQNIDKIISSTGVNNLHSQQFNNNIGIKTNTINNNMNNTMTNSSTIINQNKPIVQIDNKLSNTNTITNNNDPQNLNKHSELNNNSINDNTHLNNSFNQHHNQNYNIEINKSSRNEHPNMNDLDRTFSFENNKHANTTNQLNRSYDKDHHTDSNYNQNSHSMKLNTSLNNNNTNNNYNTGMNYDDPRLGSSLNLNNINNNLVSHNNNNNNMLSSSTNFNLNDLNLNNLSKEQLVSLLINKELQSQNQSSNQYLQEQKFNKFNYYDTQVREISSKDKAELVSKGALTLHIEQSSESLTQFSLENELKAEQQAVTYLVHFIAYKPSQGELNRINKGEEKENKMQFIFTFWDFENNISDAALISKPENKVYSSSVPFVLVKEKNFDDKQIKVKISHDPENDNYTDYRYFIDYLLTKSVFVQVFDPDSLFSLGYVKIPLKDFLRNGKTSKIIQKEYEMYDYYSHESKGFVVSSISISSSLSKFNYNPLRFKQITSSGNHAFNAKKKLSVRPMNIDSLTKEEKELIGNELLVKNNFSTNSNYRSTSNVINSINNKPIKLNVDPEIQKRLRVMKYSNMVNKSDKYNFDNTNSLSINNERLQELKTKQEKEDKYFNSLDLAHKIKEIKKKQVIQQTIEMSSKNSLNISLIAGQPHFFNYIIKNDSDREESFHVIVSKPIETVNNKSNFTKVASEDCVKVINDPIMWANAVEQEKHTLVAPRNNEYDCISDDFYFVLKPEEKIPLLVKLMSFDLSTSNKNYTIWVYKGKEPLEYLQVTIVKVMCNTDHQFEFNVPDNRASVLNIPNPFKVTPSLNYKSNSYNNNNNNNISVSANSITSLILKNQVSTNSAYSLSTDPSTNDFAIKYKPGEVNDNKDFSFYIYLYTNELKLKLYSCWEINIHSLETLDVQTTLGNKVVSKFFVESSERRTIKCFANNDIVYFTEKCSQAIVLIPDIPNEVKFVTYPKKKEKLVEVLINVVDISNRVIVKQVLVRVIPENPVFSHVVRIDCNVGTVTHFKYEYQSKLTRWAIVKFESNDEEYLRIIDSTLHFNPGETKQIGMVVPEQSSKGVSEVVMFISDSEEIYSETILFQFHFK